MNDRSARASLGPAVIILALLPFGFGGWGTFKGWQTLNWPRATATIESAGLKVRESTYQDNGESRRSEMAIATIVYSYRVNGTEYQSVKLQPYSFGMQNSGAARRMKTEYPEGSKHNIAYSPDDHSEAYLEPGPSNVSLFLLGIGVILLVFGWGAQALRKPQLRRGSRLT